MRLRLVLGSDTSKAQTETKRMRTEHVMFKVSFVSLSFSTIMDVDRQEDASMFNEGDAKGEPVHESGALHDDTDPILPRNKPPFATYEYDVEAQMIGEAFCSLRSLTRRLCLSCHAGTMVSWVIPYRGNLHKELWDHISRMYRNGQERMCAVVQSSGTGKSRMVDELGKERFVIPICVRKGSSGESPRYMSRTGRHLRLLLT